MNDEHRPQSETEPAPDAPIDVERLRRSFPVTRDLAYMNHAAIAPLPEPAARRMGELGRTVAATGDRRWPERDRECERVRRRAAEILGAEHPHEVAFTGNTSEALSAVAWGIDWRDGDNVVGAGPEFPSNVYPWTSLGALGVEHRRVPERDGRVPAQDVLAAVDGRTRAVAVSWVQYASGYRIDLAALAAGCRERDVLLVVDAIQGVGGLAFDVNRSTGGAGVDAVALASHKWLLGPEGVGLLYVADRAIGRLRSTRHGWRSVASRFDWTDFDPTPAQGALRFEAGTLNVYGIHALGASLDLLLDLGPERVEERVLALAARSAEGLEKLGFELAFDRGEPSELSGIVAGVHPDRDARELASALEEEGIVASHRAGRFRVSPHVYNTEEEVDRMLDVLAGLV